MRPAEISAEEIAERHAPARLRPGPAVLDALDRVLATAAAISTILAGIVLTYSVVVRDLLHWSTDWQDEVSVFLLVGATFLSAPYVQARRGHIAIEALAGFLTPAGRRIRLLCADGVCLAFIAVFGWQCWLLLLDAIESGEVTDSVFAPPLWLPYGTMTAGITLLGLRFLVQVVDDGVQLVQARS